MIELLSIELTNRCTKGCTFCYASSLPTGNTVWTADEVVHFVEDCARHGLSSVSFGGGEPLEHPGFFEILARLRGVAGRTVTTHGLLLTGDRLHRLVAERPDRVHISIHEPRNSHEVARVTRQIAELRDRGLRAGVNLLVRRSEVEAAQQAVSALGAAGIARDDIILLPMRGADTPSPAQVAFVAGEAPFLSTTCLMACASSPRFVSVSWDRRVAWCSYTTAKQCLPELDHRGLMAALTGLGLSYCGGGEETPALESRHTYPSGKIPLLAAFGPPAAVPTRIQHPAAHSMDTGWYAVDRDGVVGYFESGEAGAVPAAFFERFHLQYHWTEFVQRLPADRHGLVDLPRAAPTPAAATIGLDVLLADLDEASAAFPELDLPGSGWISTALVLRSREVARAMSADWSDDDAPLVVLREEPLVVASLGRDFPVDQVRRWIEEGHVIGASPHRSVNNGPFEELGVVRFGHEGIVRDEYLAAPYRPLHRPPPRPLTLSELPPDLQRDLEDMRLDARFCSGEPVQPAELALCWSHQSAWVGTDDRVHEFTRELERVLELMHTGSARNREFATSVLADSATPRAQARLLEAVLTDPDDEVVKSALHWLCRCDDTRSRSFQAVMADTLARTDSVEAIDRFKDALGTLRPQGHWASEGMQVHLASASTHVRVSAARALWAIDQDASRSIPVLTDAVQSGEALVRNEALTTLGEIAKQLGSREIDPIFSVRRGRASATRRSLAKSLPAVVAALSSIEPGTRALAAATLALLPDPDGRTADALRGQLARESSAEVQTEIRIALASTEHST